MDCMSASYMLLVAILNNGGSSIHSHWTGGLYKCQVQATDIKFPRGIKRCTLHDMMQNKNTTQELNIFLDLDKIRDN
jgi:hypothetical protein